MDIVNKIKHCLKLQFNCQKLVNDQSVCTFFIYCIKYIKEKYPTSNDCLTFVTPLPKTLSSSRSLTIVVIGSSLIAPSIQSTVIFFPHSPCQGSSLSSLLVYKNLPDTSQAVFPNDQP